MLVGGDGHLDWRIRECEGLRLEQRFWEAASSEGWTRGCCEVDVLENVWIGGFEVDLDVLRVEKDGKDAAASSVAC